MRGYHEFHCAGVPKGRCHWAKWRNGGASSQFPAASLAAQEWDSAYVFFKHEDEARAPELARRFAERLET